MKPPVASTDEGSRFHLVPDPPVAGKPVEVTYIGPATEVLYQVDGDKPVKIKPDKEGKFRIPSLDPGDELMFSDNRGLPGYLHKYIVHLD